MSLVSVDAPDSSFADKSCQLCNYLSAKIVCLPKHQLFQKRNKDLDIHELQKEGEGRKTVLFYKIMFLIF